MSREFGDECGGFFHEKISHALDDAKGGRTDGAKLMESILLPLAEIAYEVSSEEAGDSGSESVVEAISGAIDRLETALQAMRWYVQPSRKMAAKAIAATLKKSVAPVFDHDRKNAKISIPRDLIPDSVPREVWRDAIAILCDGMRVVSASWGTGDSCLTYHASRSADGFAEAAVLREELAALKLGITPSPAAP